MATIEKVGKISSLPKDDFLTLGALLKRLKGADPIAFEAEVRARDLKPRKVHYLIEVATAFEALPVDRADIIGVGWTKAAAIAPHVTKENAAHLIALAKKQPAHSLREIASDQGGSEAKRVILVYLSQSEFSLLAETLVHFDARLKGNKLHGTKDALVKAMRFLQRELKSKKDHGSGQS